MKSPSLDSFYCAIDKHIALAQAYSEIRYLDFLIRACRMKPYDYMLNKKHNKLMLYRHWFDEFGHSLRLDGKKISLTYYDLTIDQNKIVCTDLYYGLSLSKIVKISKLAYFHTGRKEDLSPYIMAAFLGIDNYLRCYWLSEDGWKQVSPLMLGVDALAMIKDRRHFKHFQKLEIKENTLIPCFSSQRWLSYLPPSQEFLAQLNQQCEIAASIFTKE